MARDGLVEPGVDEDFLLHLLIRWKTVVVAALLTGCLGLGLAFLQSPVYESRATVLFPGDDSSSPLSGLLKGAGGSDEEGSLPLLSVGPGRQPAIDSAAAILKSRSTAEKVVTELGLEQQWGSKSMEAAVRRFREKVLRIEKVSREQKLTLAARSGEPELARRIVSEVLGSYADYTSGAVLTRAKRQRLFVEQQVAESQKKLQEVEERLLAFEKEHGLTILEAQPENAGEVVVGLFNQRMESELALEHAQALVTELRGRDVAMASRLEADSAFPEATDDPVVASLQQDVTDARLELARKRLTRTEEHPEVVAARRRLENLEEVLRTKAERVGEAYREGLTRDLIAAEAELAAARSRQESVSRLVEAETSRLGDVPAPRLAYERLQRELLLRKKLEMQLELEFQRARIAEERESMDLEILDPPNLPDQPVAPCKLLFLVGGMVTGFVLGFGLAIRSYLSPILRRLATRRMEAE